MTSSKKNLTKKNLTKKIFSEHNSKKKNFKCIMKYKSEDLPFELVHEFCLYSLSEHKARNKMLKMRLEKWQMYALKLTSQTLEILPRKSYRK